MTFENKMRQYLEDNGFFGDRLDAVIIFIKDDKLVDSMAQR